MGEALEQQSLTEPEKEKEKEADAGAPPGPYAVGRYARKLRDWMRERRRVRLIGEVTGVSRSRVQVYFELRDAEGAVPCAIWRNDLKRSEIPKGSLRDGAEVVVVGGPDYYPGGGQASPSFYFRATEVRLAGEGDLLARLRALREQLRSEGLFEPQKRVPRVRLPKTIGVVTAEAGAARRDLTVALQRRGWGGTVVFAFAPVQDRRAAPAITTAIQDLAARPEIEAIIVTRGGGSLADLWAFCDETLCRTVAMLRVPVISAVGHEKDSTLIDDVAAVACSTPTHAAEAAVPVDCGAARRDLARAAGSLRRGAERGVTGRVRHLDALARGPIRALQRERSNLGQKIREIRAASERGVADRSEFQKRIVAVVFRRAGRRIGEQVAGAAEIGVRRRAALQRAGEVALQRRSEALQRAIVTLRAHDPEQTLERGYALVETVDGKPVSSAAAAVAAETVRLQFADGVAEAGRLRLHSGDDAAGQTVERDEQKGETSERDTRDTG